MLDELCQRLTAEGLPLWRVSVFVRMLRPNLMGRRFTSMPGRAVEISSAPSEVLDSTEFRQSPVVRI